MGPILGEARPAAELIARGPDLGRRIVSESDAADWPRRAALSAVTCPVCRTIVDNSARQCPSCGFRPGSLPDSVLPNFGLGTTDYTFQSASGVDYDYSVHSDKNGTSYFVSFTAPGGPELEIHILDGPGGPARWSLFVWLNDVLVTPGGMVRAAELQPPLRQVVVSALQEINAESEARRFHAYAGIAQGRRQPFAEATPLDRLRADFDLGPDNYEFDSDRRWHYLYEAGTADTLASVTFDAPSGSEIVFVFKPTDAGSRRDVRLKVFLDDVNATERRSLLTVAQFPEPIQWLIGAAIADLNAESERRKARLHATIARAAFREPGT